MLEIQILSSAILRDTSSDLPKNNRVNTSAKPSDNLLLKIKCPTRLARPTRPTQKPIAERKAPTKINQPNERKRNHET